METPEQQLDSFDASKRSEALEALCEQVRTGRISLPKPGEHINLHCHTFFSYNTYGYTPTRFAWMARKAGLAVAGIVDFDVLDGLDEFLTAGRLLNLRVCGGLETRVYVPEFADKEMTSPGEPGITYHMGVGFPWARLASDNAMFLSGLRQTARNRNVTLMERVNRYLKPVELDYNKDVLPLTPAGNATERHLCLAYARRARSIFPDDHKLAAFWSEKLGTNVDAKHLPDTAWLLNLIRAKTMKRGGAGYVVPDAGAFPKMDQTNRFILAASGIPTLTWLDGTSDGEKEIERLLDIACKSGVAAINIIPDRNYTPGVKDHKLANLYSVVESAQRRHLPVVVGTEMNSPGQKFVDTFETAELAPLVPVFLKGAHIVYAHSILQQTAGLGYLSDWARTNFSDAAAKNEFYERLGRLLEPQQQYHLAGVSEQTTPGQILKRIEH